MRELIYDNVRIQFLSEEVLRLEVRYGAYFTDRNTLWIPDRGAFEKAGKEAAGKSKQIPGKSGQAAKLGGKRRGNSGTQPSAAVLLGDLLLVLPNPKEGLRGFRF